MATVKEWMLQHKEALAGEDKPSPGPPVLIESGSTGEVLLPHGVEAKTGGKMKRQRWATQLIAQPGESEAAQQRRVERMMALNREVEDGSHVFQLVKGSQNSAPHICVGRGERNDIVLHDSTISTQHAQFELNDEGVFLTDGNSSNGTFVNQKQLGPGESVKVVSGDCVRLGGRVFYYLNGERLLLFLDLRIVKDNREEVTV